METESQIKSPVQIIQSWSYQIPRTLTTFATELLLSPELLQLLKLLSLGPKIKIAGWLNCLIWIVHSTKETKFMCDKYLKIVEILREILSNIAHW